MSEPTPGPWHLRMHPPSDWNPEEYPDAVVGADGKNVVFCCVTITMAGREGEQLANTRLIAAAPEMLEALKDVFALMDEGWLVRNTSEDHKPSFAMRQLSFVQRLATAHAAIAKAEVRPLTSTLCTEPKGD